MSNRLFQGVIYQMKDAFDRTTGVIDENGVVIACSDLGKMGAVREGVVEGLPFANEVMSIDGYTYRYMGSGQKSEYTKTKNRAIPIINIVAVESRQTKLSKENPAISLSNAVNVRLTVKTPPNITIDSAASFMASSGTPL